MHDRIRLNRKKTNTSIVSNPPLVSSAQITNVDLSTHTASSGHDLSRIAPRSQAKLSISQPGDAYEREADSIAQKVMGMGDRSIQQQATPQENEQVQLKPVGELITPLVQREEIPEEEEELQAKSDGNLTIQREAMPEEEEEDLQMKADANHSIQREEVLEEEEEIQAKSAVQRDGNGSLAAGNDISDKLHSRQGGGSPLSDDVRSFMEPRFGVDFSNVKVHTDGEAVQMARDVGAQAFAYGSDVYFGAGKSPGNNDLTAHELTHVVQQTGGIQTKPVNNRTIIQRDPTNPTVPSGQKQQGESNPLLEKARPFMEKLNTNDMRSNWDETKVENTINSLPDPELKRQIGKNKPAQAEFLAGMLQYNNNSLQQTIGHFMGIRNTNVPGEVHLHNSAAERLEMVAGEIEKLGQPMPATTVALGLRGRYSPHNKLGRGLMAHPMGYAIDYRATTNPMITDRRLVTLIQLVTGEEHTNFQVEPSYKKRRSLIKKMGKEHALGEQVPSQEETDFSEKFDREFERLSKAAEKFKTDLPPGLLELQSLKKESKKLEQDLKNLKKKHKPTQKTQGNSDINNNEIDRVTQELEQVNEKTNKIQSDLPTLFKPWTDKINLQKQEIINSNSGQEILLEVDGKSQTIVGSSLITMKDRDFEAVKKQIDDQLKNLKNSKKTIALKLKSRKTSEADLQDLLNLKKKQTEQETRANANLEILKKISSKKTKYDQLLNLETALNTDRKFSLIGKSTVTNPSVFQLADRGFFTPDNEVKQGEKMNSNKHGFNLLFMKSMLKYGFDQGINWDPTNSDAMHFELVEGVESIT